MKLSLQFNGPYQVLKKFRTIAYQLDLPLPSKFHSVFHVSCLKDKLGDQILPFPTLPLVVKNCEIHPEHELIVDSCKRNIVHRCVIEVLIKWVGAQEIDNTWELLEKLKKLYPHLVVKVF